MKTVELIDEVASLPIEERARLVDTLLRSLNTPESAVDSAWMEVAQHRLDELRAGRVEPLQVFYAKPTYRQTNSSRPCDLDVQLRGLA